MWKQASKYVEDMFFKDEIKLYKNTFTENEIGEKIVGNEIVGSYACNIENNPNTLQSSTSGQSSPQTIRISTKKVIPLQYDETYQVEITKARITFTDEMWNVQGWTEGQLSTVITATREVIV